MLLGAMLLGEIRVCVRGVPLQDIARARARGPVAQALAAAAVREPPLAACGASPALAFLTARRASVYLSGVANGVASGQICICIWDLHMIRRTCGCLSHDVHTCMHTDLPAYAVFIYLRQHDGQCVSVNSNVFLWGPY